MRTVTDLLLFAPLVLTAGFALQRGQICSVLAAKQIVETGSASRLAAFGYAIAWVVLLTVPLSYAFPGTVSLAPTYPLSITVLAFGALYGLGAFINGACLFGICSRSVSGSVEFLAAIPGIAIGSALAARWDVPASLGPPRASMLQELPALAMTAVIAAAAVVIYLAINVAKGVRRSRMTRAEVLKASRWRSSFALSLIAVSMGVLFAVGMPASYTVLPKQAGAALINATGSVNLADAAIAAGYFVGALLSLYFGGRFRFVMPTSQACLRCLAGGIVMSFAASAIPGGNDVMILHGIPGLAINAIAGYAVMMATLIACIYVSSSKDSRAASRA